ncbi:MAG: right-handed parallel beta-helix repeat-containing protein [Actinomycetota bacterium]|nr:right-handed parallel beta-helix repeat-containing protein [Actinomycetota bacterium]
MKAGVRKAAAWAGVMLPFLLVAAGSAAQTGDPPAPTAPVTAGEQPSPVDQDRSTGAKPTRNRQKHEPFKIVRYPSKLDPRTLGIRLTPTAIDLVQGGQLVRSLPFDGARTVGFEEMVRAVGDPAWIAEVSPGVFGLRAAFVQAPGTHVRFVQPGTRELRLARDPPGVFIGGQGPDTSARFEGVKVTSWDLTQRRPSEDVGAVRPFILYEWGARLDITRSEMAYLGSDHDGSYGVSWRLGGATGEVTDSVFHHCFFAIYTYEAKDLVFRRNVFRDNLYYGLDPHDATTGVVAEANEAYGNGSHGFIFSKYVSDGVLRGNHSHHNGGNGIVLDDNSDRNVVAGNRVENNQGDGIVLLGSSRNIIEDNVVSGNRIGVRANKPGEGNVVRRNRIEGNDVGVHAYGGASKLTLRDNQVEDSGRAGIILDAAGSAVWGGNVSGGDNAIEIRQPAVVSGVEVDRSRDGVVVRPGASAELERLRVRVSRVGIRVEPGGSADVSGSRVVARTPTRGEVKAGPDSRLGKPEHPRPLPWLALAGLVAVCCAVLFEVLAHARDRRTRRLLSPS